MASGIFALAATLFIQTISAQFIGQPAIYGSNIANAIAAEATFANNIIPENIYIPENSAVFNGGGFKVTSYSPVAPTGITLQSDNLVVEGPLTVTGKLPFLGVVSIEGPLPAVGQGTVSYGCGNGNVGITSETVAPEGVSPLVGFSYNGIPNGLPVGPMY